MAENKTTNTKSKRKLVIVISAVLIVVLIWVILTTIANNKKEKQILANLSGAVFSYIEETDIERLGADYNYTYYNWVFDEEITFDADGRFTYVSSHIQYYYPDSLGRKNEARENQSIVDTHSGNYSVNISLFGKISIELPSDTSSTKYYTADGGIGNPTFSGEIILENGKPYGLMMSNDFYYRVK